MSVYVSKGIVYELNMGHKIGMVKFADANMIEAKIEPEVKGCIIDTIGARAFYHCEKLKKIHIPKTIFNIKNDAFAHCYNLTNINGNNELFVEVLGYRVFSSCKSLPILKLPNLRSMGKEVFKDCLELNTVIFNQNAFHVIEENTFMNCEKLSNLTIPKSVEKIQDCMKGCKNLNVLRIENKDLDLSPILLDLDKDKLIIMGLDNSKSQELLKYGYNFLIKR